MFCPQCKSEYVPGITVCPECDVQLVPELLKENTIVYDTPIELVEIWITYNAGELALIKSLLTGSFVIVFVVATGYTKCKSGWISFSCFIHEGHVPHESEGCLFSHNKNCE